MNIEISIATTHQDILSLADLRYQEWMANDPNPPQLSSFRMATAEIFHERRTSNEGLSLVSLATITTNTNDKNTNNMAMMANLDGSSSIIVGAAELSQIEFQGAIISENENSPVEAAASSASELIIKPMYITDVVTSSSHRRLGIGSKLMYNIERTASSLGSQCVFLHVDYDNIGAREFYKRLGYEDVVFIDDLAEGRRLYVSLEQKGGSDDLQILSAQSSFVDSNKSNDGRTTKEVVADITIDVERLARNAGTIGQVLMMKKLPVPTLLEEERLATMQTSCYDSSVLTEGEERGFGKRKGSKLQRKKKR